MATRTPPEIAEELRRVIVNAVLRYNLDHPDVDSAVDSTAEECASLFTNREFGYPDSWAARTRISVTVRVEK